MINLPKVHFFFAGLFPEPSSGQAVTNLLQYKHTASRFTSATLCTGLPQFQQRKNA